MVRVTATAAVEAAGLHGRIPVPRRLLDAANIEQVLVRDLFGERIAKLTVDTKAGGGVVKKLSTNGTTLSRRNESARVFEHSLRGRSPCTLRNWKVQW